MIICLGHVVLIVILSQVAINLFVLYWLSIIIKRVNELRK